jgi:N-acetyltransferase
MVSNDKTVNNNEKRLENSKSEVSPNIDHPLVGIRQIWVDKKFRKQKVANKLVDSARKNFLYGVIIPRDGIAFSQPTSDGQAFGLAYTNGRHSIWAYA